MAGDIPLVFFDLSENVTVINYRTSYCTGCPTLSTKHWAQLQDNGLKACMSKSVYHRLLCAFAWMTPYSLDSDIH